METKTLNKYIKSRLNGSLIKNLIVYNDGKVIINAENGESKEFYVNNKDIMDYSADYILCEIQTNEITISKR